MIWVRTVYAVDLPYQWVLWPSWPVWRWAQMYPDDIGYSDIEYSHRRAA